MNTRKAAVIALGIAFGIIAVWAFGLVLLFSSINHNDAASIENNSSINSPASNHDSDIERQVELIRSFNSLGLDDIAHLLEALADSVTSEGEISTIDSLYEEICKRCDYFNSVVDETAQIPPNLLTLFDCANEVVDDSQNAAYFLYMTAHADDSNTKLNLVKQAREYLDKCDEYTKQMIDETATLRDQYGI